MRHLPVHPSLVHPRTGAAILALGIRKDGRPIWPVIGGDGTEDDQNDDDADDQDDQSDDDTGDKADDEPDWKSKFEAEQRHKKNLERKAKKDAATIARLTGKKPEGGSKDDGDDKPDVEKIREEAKAEAAREVLHSRVEDKIEAKARAFADPEDAVAVLLRSRDIDDFIDDGKIDVDEIADALKELGEKKPHLLAQGGKKFQGDGDGGTRKESKSRPKDLGDAVARHYQTK